MLSLFITIYPSGDFFTYTSFLQSLSEYNLNLAPSSSKLWSLTFNPFILNVKHTTVSQGVSPVEPFPSPSGLFENSNLTSFSNPGLPVSLAALSFKVASNLKTTFCPYSFSPKAFLLLNSLSTIAFKSNISTLNVSPFPGFSTILNSLGFNV